MKKDRLGLLLTLTLLLALVHLFQDFRFDQALFADHRSPSRSTAKSGRSSNGCRICAPRRPGISPSGQTRTTGSRVQDRPRVLRLCCGRSIAFAPRPRPPRRAPNAEAAAVALTDLMTVDASRDW